MMSHSFKVGASFGLTSGVITTVGLIVGLHSGTHSKLAVLGGILTIAVADAFSDALGIHMSEESEDKHTAREIWISTLTTFLFKFAVASTFIVPIMLIENLTMAIMVSVSWGIFLLSLFSYLIGRGKRAVWKIIFEHVAIAILVIIAAHMVGDYISTIFT